MLARQGLGPYTAQRIEVLGAESCYGPHAQAHPPREVILRVTVTHPHKEALDLFSREVAPAGTSWSPGTTGSGSGRSAASPSIRQYAFLLNKTRLLPQVLLDEAIFTHPAHPNWGGTGLISARGELIGIGSLQMERVREGKPEHVNMIVPIDLLKPVLDDIRKFGRVNKPSRPWLGMYTTEIDNRLVVVGIASKGPAARAELKTGDVILAVNGDKITSQAGFYRKLWSLGAAGVDVPLTVYHEGVTFDVVLSSTDRARLLKAPRLH